MRKMVEKIGRRRNGRIAKLPKRLRNQVNVMLEDGLTYREIVERLGEKGKGITRRHLLSWRKGGHQDWLKQQDRLERMERIREFAVETAKENEGAVIQEAGMSMMATQIYELLNEFDASTLKEKLEGNPENYARLGHVLARLSEGGLGHERYRAEVAERKANIQKAMAEARPGGISPETRKRIEEELNLL